MGGAKKGVVAREIGGGKRMNSREQGSGTSCASEKKERVEG